MVENWWQQQVFASSHLLKKLDIELLFLIIKKYKCLFLVTALFFRHCSALIIIISVLMAIVKVFLH